MAALANRQNLTSDELANAVEVYDKNGHFDAAKTKAANDVIFHPNNGHIQKDPVGTLAKQKSARDKFIADNK